MLEQSKYVSHFPELEVVNNFLIFFSFIYFFFFWVIYVWLGPWKFISALYWVM